MTHVDTSFTQYPPSTSKVAATVLKLEIERRIKTRFLSEELTLAWDGRHANR